jgi:hypothetical protein
VLTIIESASSVWMVTTVDDELRIYARAEAGEWGELSLGEDPEEVDPEKSFMLEELYARQGGQEEEAEGELEGEEEAEEGEPEGEEEESDEEEAEPDEDEPELAEDEESEGSEDEEPEEEEKPRRRRAAAAKSGRATARRK